MNRKIAHLKDSEPKKEETLKQKTMKIKDQGKDFEMKTVRLTGIEQITIERKRQIEFEGYDEKHDDEHAGGELAMAAMCYAMLPCWRPSQMAPIYWPWSNSKPMDGFKPSFPTSIPQLRILELAKAGALIAAEIDRLNRLDERMEKDTF